MVNIRAVLLRKVLANGVVSCNARLKLISAEKDITVLSRSSPDIAKIFCPNSAKKADATVVFGLKMFRQQRAERTVFAAKPSICQIFE